MDTLYHYCSTPAFYSIVQSNSIRLSSLLQSNDYSEGALVTESVIGRLRADGHVDPFIVKTLEEIFHLAVLEYECLAFCLSAADDLLSQWRGYASDCAGVAIGFPRSYLEDLAMQHCSDMRRTFLCQVDYSPNAAAAEISGLYEEMKELIDKGAFSSTAFNLSASKNTNDDVHPAMATEMFHDYLENAWIDNFYTVKGEGFSEEKEWRLMTNRRDVSGRSARAYRIKEDRIIPYYAIKLAGVAQVPIEVVLGPKHQTPEYTVSAYLHYNGFQARVRRSAITYR